MKIRLRFFISIWILGPMIVSVVSATSSSEECLASYLNMSTTTQWSTEDICLDSILLDATEVIPTIDTITGDIMKSDTSYFPTVLREKPLTQPSQAVSEQDLPADYAYSSWEIDHRQPMLSGFTWSGEIANFINPWMYIGTPIRDTTQIQEQTKSFSESTPAFVFGNSTTYKDCIINESYSFYGPHKRIKDNNIKALKTMAKTCARKFYGSYFEGKPFTTREEYLMMLLTMFGENVGFDGQFTNEGKYSEKGNGITTPFVNVKPTSWYAPYLARSDDIGLLPSDEKNWQVAKEITDKEATRILSRYIAYRMDSLEDPGGGGVIITPRLKYTIEFLNEDEVIINVQ